MFIPKRPRSYGFFRLLGMSSLLTTCFLLVKNLIVDDGTSMTFIAPDALQNTSNSSCRSVPILNGLTKSYEKRCYPLLINFADGCCRQSQKNNCLTGLQYGIRQCLMFNKRILQTNPDFLARNKDILERKRGAGYWLWKPYIIFRELHLASDGDIIVYSDAAVDVIANISYLTKLTEQQDIIVFRLADKKESVWTKRDAMILLGVDKPEYVNTSASLASYIVIKKTLTSMIFVSQWLTYAQDSRAITDDKNVLGSDNYPDFRRHRHDQSLLSLLAKKWGLIVYPDPSQWGSSPDRPYPTIFNHHRSMS